MRRNHGMPRYAGLLLALGLAGPGLAAGDSPEDLIRQLGSDAFGKREAASAALRTLLMDCNGAGRVDEFRKILALLRGASAGSDPEVRERAENVLKGFKKGAPLWERGLDQMPGAVGRLCVYPEGIVAAGAFPRRGNPPGGWIGCYAADGGKPAWEKTDCPGPVESLERDGDRLVFRGHDAHGLSWLATADLRNGNVAWMRNDLPEQILAWDFSKDGILVWGRIYRTVDQGGGKVCSTPGDTWIALLDRQSGKPLWERKANFPDVQVHTLHLVNGRIWVLGTDETQGRLLMKELVAPEGKNPAGNGAFAVPGPPKIYPSDDAVYACGEGWIGCYRCGLEQPVWEFTFPNRENVCRVIPCPEGLLACGNDWLSLHDRSNGKLLWQSRGLPLSFSVRLSPLGVLTWNDEAYLQCVETRTGKVFWQCQVSVLGHIGGLGAIPDAVIAGGRGKGPMAVGPGDFGPAVLSPLESQGWLGAYRLRDADE